MIFFKKLQKCSLLLELFKKFTSVIPPQTTSNIASVSFVRESLQKISKNSWHISRNFSRECAKYLFMRFSRSHQGIDSLISLSRILQKTVPVILQKSQKFLSEINPKFFLWLSRNFSRNSCKIFHGVSSSFFILFRNSFKNSTLSRLFSGLSRIRHKIKKILR